MLYFLSLLEEITCFLNENFSLSLLGVGGYTWLGSVLILVLC